ncbi:hypothetical protein J7Q84_01115 [Bacillus sp. 165]|nr:hypothetical protein [Bacillus sp. 165]
MLSDKGSIVTVSTIIQLNSGDTVDVFLNSTVDGKVESNHPEGVIRFEGARFPSPDK